MLPLIKEPQSEIIYVAIIIKAYNYYRAMQHYYFSWEATFYCHQACDTVY